jgi:RNA polymerase sigma-B factor
VPERSPEEQKLFQDYPRSRGGRAREALVERYLPLAYSLARRYARGEEPLEDLEQVASLALIKAVDGYDAARGSAFSSYAVPSIVGAIKRHYRDVGWAVRPPRKLQELALRVKRLEDELGASMGSRPTAAQIAEHAGVGVEDVLEAREAHHALHAHSLDQPHRGSAGEDGAALIDTLGVRDAGIRRAFDHVVLEALLTTLDSREREIVRLYYQQELTQSEIGRRLGYSQMHISRLLRRAVEKLLLAAAAGQERDLTRSSAA